MNKVEEIEKNEKVSATKETETKKKTTNTKTKTTTKAKEPAKVTTKAKSKAETKTIKAESKPKARVTTKKESEPKVKAETKTTKAESETKTKVATKTTKVDTKAKIATKTTNVETKIKAKTPTKTAKAEITNEAKSSVVVDALNVDTDNNENIIEKNEKVTTANKEETRKFKVINDDFENKPKKSKSHKFALLVTTIAILLFIGLILFSTVFGIKNRFSNKVVSGVSVKGIDISGLTYDEANEKISKTYYEKTSKSITLKHNEYEITINPDEIEASFGTKEALNMAYSIGRSGKILKDNYAIINAYLAKTNINPSFSYNEKKLDKFLNELSENLPDAVQQSSYAIEGENLKITKGQKGFVVKKDELKAAILDNITNLKDEKILQIPVEEKEPDDIDIEKIHTEIYKEAKDAYYTKEPFTVYPHIDGVDFNIGMEEAKNLVNSNQTEIIIPLKITKPNVTTNKIGTEAFPDLLATYSTTFSTKNTNRTTNIKLASNKINGVVLMPGEQFSYNKVVGQRTAAAGYKTAAVYVGGKVENGIGGGICQVSSTLYNTALRANLEIVKRSNHRFATGYVPLSTDATVSWGGPEFVFKNTRKYPIKIQSTVTGGKIKVDIYGLKEDVEYEVIIQSQTLQRIPMKTEYRTNPSLPAGTKKTVQKGHGGYKSRAYRILKLNGEIVSKQLLSTDTYAQLSTIIETN